MFTIEIQLFGGRGTKAKVGKMVSFSNAINVNTVNETHEINAKKYETLEDWEKAIRFNNYETLIAFNEKGEPVKAYKGSNNSVNILDEVGMLWEGYVVTHNHPGRYGGTFSPDDILNLAKYKYKELRAVTEEGTYIIRQTKSSNFPKFNILCTISMPKLKTTLRNEAERLRGLYEETPKENRISIHEREKMIKEYCCMILNKYYNKLTKECGFDFFME